KYWRDSAAAVVVYDERSAMRDRFHWARLLSFVTGLVNQELLLRNEYLTDENRILRAHLPARLRLSDAERSTLAEVAKRLGRKALQDVARVAKPDTRIVKKLELAENTRYCQAGFEDAMLGVTRRFLGDVTWRYAPVRATWSSAAIVLRFLRI